MNPGALLGDVMDAIFGESVLQPPLLYPEVNSIWLNINIGNEETSHEDAKTVSAYALMYCNSVPSKPLL